MNSKQYQYAVLLAETGSFSQAADRLGISQPAFSKYIKNIESEVGAELFVRADGQIILSAEGEVFIDTARQILQLEGNLPHRIEDVRNYQTGTIRIAVSPFRALCILPSAIRRFREVYPGIRIVIDDRKGTALLAAVAQGEYDLCLAELPVSDPNLRCVRAFRENVVLAVSNKNPLGEELRTIATAGDGFPKIDVSAVAGKDFITLFDHQVMQKILNSLCGENEISVRSVITCHSVETQMALVREGQGCALIPSSLISLHNEPELRYYSFVQNTPTREIAVVYRKDRYLTEPMQFFISLLAK